MTSIENEKIKQELGFTKLICWQAAHDFTLLIYKATESFPSREIYSLVSQFRRAAISVSSNIAEGYGRSSQPDRLHFYAMARGSLLEAQSQILLANDLGYLRQAEYSAILEQSIVAHKLLNGLVAKIRKG